VLDTPAIRGKRAAAMTTATVRHAFDIDVDTYWEKVFFDEEYTRRLYADVLSFESVEFLEATSSPDGVRTRKIRVKPKNDAPAVVQKVIGEAPSSLEDGRFDPAARVFRFHVTLLGKLADKVKISGDIKAVSTGDKRIDRVVTLNVSASIFGIGGIVESYIEKTLRDSYDKGAVFTRTFIVEKKL
jgi:hypothetical protein